MKYIFNNAPDFGIEITSISEGYGFEVNLTLTTKNKQRKIVNIQRTYKFPSKNIFEQWYYGYWRNKGRFLEKIQPYLTWSSNEEENVLINNQQGELFQMAILKDVELIESSLNKVNEKFKNELYELINSWKSKSDIVKWDIETIFDYFPFGGLYDSHENQPLPDEGSYGFERDLFPLVNKYKSILPQEEIESVFENFKTDPDMPEW